MEKLSDMPNIGAVLEEKLKEAGINTPQQLIEAGSKKVFLQIRLKDTGACLNMLYGLEGAVQNIRWHHLPEREKQLLKEFYTKLG